MRLQAGQRVAARLRLQRPLRAGGMGAVWIARHETLGSEVAVKFIQQATSSRDPRSSERFQREASLAATLNSPHVARTYDHGVLADGTPFIVMELLEGESLSQRLRRRGSLSMQETSLLLKQAAHALTKAHHRGIIHRDIKPSNIFLVDTDYEIFLKLLDFGIAKQTKHLGGDRLTQTGMILGSPQYMSPEALTQTRDVDWRGDLWALAVVAYECLTGTRPFHGGSLIEIARAVMDVDYEPPRMLCPQLPAALDAWFRRAFHSDIERRPQSARELAESFASIAEEDDTIVEPIAFLPPSELSTTQPYEKTTPNSLAAGVSAVMRSIGPALSVPPPSAAPMAQDKRSGGRGWTVSAVMMLLLVGVGLACVMLSV